MLKAPFRCLNLLLLLLSLGFATQSFGQDLTRFTELVKTSLLRLDNKPADQHWFFTMTTQLEGETLVAKNNPELELGQRLQLLTIDGETASAERLQKFAEQEQVRAQTRKENGGPAKYSAIIAPDSLTLLEQNDQSALLSFVPQLGELDSKKLKGRIRLDLKTQNISEISIENVDKLSPAFSVSISEFKLAMQFTPLADDLLLSRMESKTIGKIGFLKDLDNHLVVDFSDFSAVN